jgi:hypothetical protein
MIEDAGGNGRAKRRKADASQFQSRVELCNLGASVAAVARIAEKLRENPDINVHRAALRRASASVHAPLFRSHQLQLEKPDEPFQWEFLDPNLLVAHMVDASPKLSSVFREAFAKHACTADSQWHLCMAWDEFTAGNVLSSQNARKTMVLSFSFLELGQENLWHEECWFSPVIVRSKIISRAKCGWSGMLRAYLHAHLFSATGISTAGLPLMLDGKPFLLFAKLSHMLADGDGHRLALEWKGASGLKCCMRHWNVLMLDSDLACRDPTFVEIDCSDPSKFRALTTSEVADQADAIVQMRRLVSERRATKVRLESLEKVCGFSISPLGILADIDLRRRVDFMQAVRYDWMHCALQDGIMSVESSLLFNSACSVGGVLPAEVEMHLKHDWAFPHYHRSKGNNLWRIFDHGKKTDGDARVVKAAASQMIILHSLLRHFFTQRIGSIAALEPQLKSYCAACDCVDIVLLAKRRLLPMAQAATRLQGALRHHMLCHVAAYGKGHLKPKFHYMWDVAEQFARDPFVLDCFVVERLHLRAKRSANLVENTRSYERSVLTGVVGAHSVLLGEGSAEFGLVGVASDVPGPTKASVARACVSHGVSIAAGDLVFRDERLGRVASCVMEGGALFMLVNEMRPVERLSGHSSVWSSAPATCQVVWRAHDVVPAVAWTKSTSTNTTVIRM